MNPFRNGQKVLVGPDTDKIKSVGCIGGVCMTFDMGASGGVIDIRVFGPSVGPVQGLVSLNVRPGFPEIRYRIDMDSPSDPSHVQALLQYI